MNRLILGLAMVFIGSAAWTQETAPAQEVTKESTQTDASKTEKPKAADPVAESSASSSSRNVRADRLDLETTVVTGNRELPKVLYIVPWKKAELGELPAQPFNTLLDEVLQPVDRDEFRREVQYFHAIKSGADTGAANPAAAPQ